MAKHRKSRRYRGLMPLSFGKLLPDFNRSANGTDVLIGAAAAAFGALGIRYLWNRFLPVEYKAKSIPVADATGKINKSIWCYVDEYLPALGAAAAAAGLYFLQKAKNPSKAFGHALGGAAVAAGITGLWLGQDLVPSFNGIISPGLVTASFNGYRGVVVPDRNKQFLRGIVMPSGQKQIEPGARWRTAGVQMAAYRALAARR